MDNVEEIFEKSGAVLNGHFLLASGLHSPVYWEKFQVLQYPEYTVQLCAMIAQNFAKEEIETVAGPTTGGIILAFEVARQMGLRSLYAEKVADKGHDFRRGFTISAGERILVVDDILSTGGSVREVIEAIVNRGGLVAGVGVLVDRSGGKVDFGVPLFACHRTEIVTYPADDCPLCRSGVALVKPGSS